MGPASLAVLEVFGGAYASFGDVATLQAVGDGTRDAVKATADLGGRLASDIGAAREAAALQAKNISEQLGDVRSDIRGDIKDTLIQLANNHGQLLMQHCDTRALVAASEARLQAKLAECCCELRDLIRVDGSETRALINANRMADLQAENTALRAVQSNQDLLTRILNGLLPGNPIPVARAAG